MMPMMPMMMYAMLPFDVPLFLKFPE